MSRDDILKTQSWCCRASRRLRRPPQVRHHKERRAFLLKHCLTPLKHCLSLRCCSPAAGPASAAGGRAAVGRPALRSSDRPHAAPRGGRAGCPCPVSPPAVADACRCHSPPCRRRRRLSQGTRKWSSTCSGRAHGPTGGPVYCLPSTSHRLPTAFPRSPTACPLPSLDLPLPAHCLPSISHCLSTAFPRPPTACPLPSLDLPLPVHCLPSISHCLSTAFP